jgi:hypothetical protein
MDDVGVAFNAVVLTKFHENPPVGLKIEEE